MERLELVNQITETSTEVLVELRHRSRLAESCFRRLMRTLTEYRDLLDGESMIEREVTGALHYLNIGFSSALDHLERVDQERFAVLESRYNDYLAVMREILDPATQAAEKEWRESEQ